MHTYKELKEFCQKEDLRINNEIIELFKQNNVEEMIKNNNDKEIMKFVKNKLNPLLEKQTALHNIINQ